MGFSEREVVVVGAGAAGVGAARRLKEAGVDCVIVEARGRAGGRAWTMEGSSIDLGCGWLHSGDRNPWVAIAERLGFRVDRRTPPWQRPAIAVNFPLPDQRAFSADHMAFDERLAARAPVNDDIPASDLLDPASRWNPLIDAISTYYSGAELRYVSARDLDRYDDSGVNWRVAEGYGALVAAHAAGLDVVLDCPVTAIDHSAPAIRVETARGPITASAVIVTVPSALLAEGRIAFTPELPQKREAAAGLPLGLADKLFLSLDGAEEFEPDSRLFGSPERTATGAYHLRPFGRPEIECYFGGSFAEALEQEGDEAFVAAAREELCDAFGHDFARRIAPIALHGWRRDPYALGSYSYARPGMAECRAALAAPVDDRLFFAGEACSGTDFSTAHGALITGIAAAEAIVAARSARR